MHFRLRGGYSDQLSYGGKKQAVPAGFEPANLPRDRRAL